MPIPPRFRALFAPSLAPSLALSLALLALSFALPALAAHADRVPAFQINGAPLPERVALGIARGARVERCPSPNAAAWHRRRAAWYASRLDAVLVHWRSMLAGPLSFADADTPAPDRTCRLPPPGRSPLQADAPRLAVSSAIALLPPAC